MKCLLFILLLPTLGLVSRNHVKVSLVRSPSEPSTTAHATAVAPPLRVALSHVNKSNLNSKLSAHSPDADNSTYYYKYGKGGDPYSKSYSKGSSGDGPRDYDGDYDFANDNDYDRDYSY